MMQYRDDDDDDREFFPVRFEIEWENKKKNFFCLFVLFNKYLWDGNKRVVVLSAECDFVRLLDYVRDATV